MKFVKAGKVAPCIAFALDRCGLFFFFAEKKTAEELAVLLLFPLTGPYLLLHTSSQCICEIPS